MPGPLDGVYHSEYLTMNICDSLATISFYEGHGITYTIAVCTLTQETDDFIRLDSPSPSDRVMNCIQFEESFSADCNPDSVYVTFDFPVRNEEYLITVCDNDTTSFNTYKEIKYPKPFGKDGIREEWLEVALQAFALVVYPYHVGGEGSTIDLWAYVDFIDEIDGGEQVLVLRLRSHREMVCVLNACDIREVFVDSLVVIAWEDEALCIDEARDSLCIADECEGSAFFDADV